MQAQKAAREEKADVLGAFMLELHERDGVISEFDDRFWLWTVEKVTVQSRWTTGFQFFQRTGNRSVKLERPQVFDSLWVLF
ncbi:MAG: hypothetical protein PHE51_02645 [Eubacteriales bacterium]|nr:hypothetical protein [Eubacteriales bacterium]